MGGGDSDHSPFFEGEVEPCINGRVLAIGAYFGEARGDLADRLLQEQLSDGGWNCYAPPSQRSSFHSTICVLEGLLEYETAAGPRWDYALPPAFAGPGVSARAAPVLSRSTAQVVKPEWTAISFPTRWHYDILWGLDYLRRAGVAPDERMAEAIEYGAEQARRPWALAGAREPASGSGALRDGRRRRRAEPLEHASSASRAALGRRRVSAGSPARRDILRRIGVHRDT